MTLKYLCLGLCLVACSVPVLNDQENIVSSKSSLTVRADGAILVYAPSVSTDSAQNPAFIGNNIMFTVFHNGYNNGPSGIFTINPASVVQTILDPHNADYVNLPGSAFNATTNRITWAADRNDVPDNIWTSNLDGTNIKQLTNINSAEEPSFSPDGSKVVFEYAPPNGNHRIGRVNADASGLVYLTDGTHSDREPNWSPSGDLIVFQRDAGNDSDLMTMTPDGNNITSLGVLGTDASFSPDGKWIVFSGGQFSQQDTIMIVAKTGGAPIRVANSSVYDGAPSWSPDGKWIAFESGGNGETATSIWKIASPINIDLPDAGVHNDAGSIVEAGTDAMNGHHSYPRNAIIQYQKHNF